MLCQKIALGLLGVALLATGHALADTVGNGGDPIRVIFIKGKEHAASVTKRLDVTRLPSNTPREVVNWLEDNFLSLAADILNSDHVWTNDVLATCARTFPESESTIILSFPICRATITDTLDAAQLLVHESVHHLGITDESFADAVGIAIHRFWQRLQPGDQGFRYNPRSGKCEDQNGDIGYNPGFMGECGDFLGQDLSNRNDLRGIGLRGANLSFTDILASNLADTNLRGSDLSFATVRRTNLQGAMFDNADLRHAKIRIPSNSRQRLEVFFNQADLSHAEFIVETEVYFLDFERAKLQGTTFLFDRNVYGSRFDYADLRNATINSRYDLRASFIGADLSGVDLSEVVIGKNFKDAILRGTNFSNYNLRKGDFRFFLEPDARAQPILTGAIFDEDTKLPFPEAEALRRGMIRR